VQVYTGFVYGGPGFVPGVHAGLARLLEKDGFASVSEAVGADLRGPPGTGSSRA
jgi:dihydroorotate dehydrogenase